MRLMSCLMKLCNPVLWEGLLGSLDPFFKNGELRPRGWALTCCARVPSPPHQE